MIHVSTHYTARNEPPGLGPARCDPGLGRQLYRQPLHRDCRDRSYAAPEGFSGWHDCPTADYSPEDITRLGEPTLFWGVRAGCLNSLVANYTAMKKKRKSDDYTPGGNNRRPDRASIVYTNLIRRNYKNTVPIVLGGIEASLRRIAHYDFWSDRVRRSILLDAKADYLLYGMAEKSIVELAQVLQMGGRPAPDPWALLFPRRIRIWTSSRTATWSCRRSKRQPRIKAR